MRQALRSLSPTERQAVQEFRNRVSRLLGSQLVSMKLFGSKARGDDTPESDVDVFIAVNKRTPGLEDRIIDMAFEIDLKYGTYISPRVVSVEILRDPVWSMTPFLQNVEKEGILL